MSQDVKESDWKRFREIREEALNRYCQGVLEEVRQIIAGAGKSYHERYGAVYKLIRDRDKELAAMFDDPRRSNAVMQLAGMRRRGLVTDEEFSRFGEELRGTIEAWLR